MREEVELATATETAREVQALQEAISTERRERAESWEQLLQQHTSEMAALSEEVHQERVGRERAQAER